MWMVQRVNEVESPFAPRLVGAGNLCRDTSANDARQTPIKARPI